MGFLKSSQMKRVFSSSCLIDLAFRSIVEAGPGHLGGRLLVLKQWKPQMNFEKNEFTKIPIWIQFFNVPLDYWTEQGISYIASAVGRPLYADAITEAGKRLSFAKICVEVEVDSILPSSFDLRFSNGESIEILIKLPMEASYVITVEGLWS